MHKRADEAVLLPESDRDEGQDLGEGGAPVFAAVGTLAHAKLGAREVQAFPLDFNIL